MLYYLFDFLDKTFDIPGSGLFRYISFRAVLAALLALVVSIWFGKYFIALLKRRNISEVQKMH